MRKSPFIYYSTPRQKVIFTSPSPDFSLSPHQNNEGIGITLNITHPYGQALPKSQNTLESFVQASTNSLSNNKLSEEVVDSEDEEQRVEEILDDEDTSFGENDSDNEMNAEVEVVENYQDNVQKQQEERDSKIQQMLALLIESEIKFNLGKYNDCFDDCCKAEQLATATNANIIYLAQALLGQGKAKFKLGDIKEAQKLIQSSITLCNQYFEGTKQQQQQPDGTNSSELFGEYNLVQMEAEHLISEVDKMCIFESLIDFSFDNPVYQQQYIQALKSCKNVDNGLSLVPYAQSDRTNILSATVRSNISSPKMITQQRYDSSKSKNSWQNTYLVYHRKQQTLAIKS